MSVALHPGRLRHEIVRRGWAPVDLARAAELSPGTVGAALKGLPIAEASVARIAKALLAAPTVDVIDHLIFADTDDRAL
jgi:hypothetical protein